MRAIVWPGGGGGKGGRGFPVIQGGERPCRCTTRSLRLITDTELCPARSPRYRREGLCYGLEN